VGAGNIGSHVLPLIGRMPEVGFITIIDKDVYEPKNLAGQDIGEGDFGNSKAHAQAQRLRGLNAHLRTWAIAESVENVPPGKLRGDVILGCLDSRESRRVVHQFIRSRGGSAFHFLTRVSSRMACSPGSMFTALAPTIRAWNALGITAITSHSSSGTRARATGRHRRRPTRPRASVR
jgi:hypothetical protein